MAARVVVRGAGRALGRGLEGPGRALRRAFVAKRPWVAAGAFIAVAGILGVARVLAAPLPEMLEPAQSSQLLAHDGQVIATIHGEENRSIVPLHEMSPHLQIAVLAAEDREFYRHHGVSVRAMARAARTNWEGGDIVQGGSTITQQLARNSLDQVGRERTYNRKIREAYWAFQMERHLSKGEIMEHYLNTVYFGRGAYGAQAAAVTYFKIPASELTIGQAAYLAGAIRSPERYQIDRNPEGAVAIRDTVLASMEEAGYLGPEEAAAGRAENLLEQFKPGMTIEVDSPRAGYFVEYARRILKRDFGLTDDEILRGGLKIHSTLDLRMQDAAEEAVRSTLDSPDDPEAALIAMDPQGRVRAMVGGRAVDDIERARGFNFAADVNATGGGRQAGSAFKPLALASFLEEGKSLSSTFYASSPIELDSPRCRNGDGTPWEVRNYGNSSFGSLDVTAATQSSVNVVFAQMMEEVVDPAMFIDLASRLGIDIPQHDAGCALTLGTSDVTPLEMAQAYTTFAQRGLGPEPLVITRVTKPDGEIIAEMEPSVERRLEENVADAVNHVLHMALNSGTGTSARIGRPAAGKTGTTQNFQDAWFAGYTPDLTAVVWMGYAPGPDGTIPVMNRVRGRSVTGGAFPATIWRKFMSEALQGTEASSFHRPRLGGEIVRPSRPPEPLLASAGSDSTDASEDSQPGVSGNAPSPDEGGPASGDSTSSANDRGQDQSADEPGRARSMFPPCFPFCN